MRLKSGQAVYVIEAIRAVTLVNMEPKSSYLVATCCNTAPDADQLMAAGDEEICENLCEELYADLKVTIVYCSVIMGDLFSLPFILPCFFKFFKSFCPPGLAISSQESPSSSDFCRSLNLLISQSLDLSIS